MFNAQIDWTSVTGVAELLIFHPVDTIAKRLMSNQAKVTINNDHVSIVFDGTFITPGLVIHVEPHTFPGRSIRTGPSQIYLSFPWPWVCCRLQSRATDVQIRRSAVVQRLDQTALWDTVHKYVR